MALILGCCSCLVACCLILLPMLPLSHSAATAAAFTCSRATYYGSPECPGTLSGACGYGELGNAGYATAVSRLYRNGTGCGACYKVRCTYPHLCTDDGMTVVVMDYGQSGYTDFILSARGFVKLARSNMAGALVAHGVIDVEYTRIACQYPGYNMMFKITENSKFPDYLSFIIVYKAGINDILAVEIWRDDCKEWKPMRQAYGAVWDMENAPLGPINLRLLVAKSDGDDGQRWIQLTAAIPCEWKAGASYDSTIQLD